jgi:hypothetical protein
MQRSYRYKEFIVEVETQAVRETLDNVAYVFPKGYLALVSIRRAGGQAASFAPLRLERGEGQPFGTEGDAIMAGFTAAQRTIDDALRVDG